MQRTEEEIIAAITASDKLEIWPSVFISGHVTRLQDGLIMDFESESSTELSLLLLLVLLVLLF
jgi:hypothetical protein